MTHEERALDDLRREVGELRRVLRERDDESEHDGGGEPQEGEEELAQVLSRTGLIALSAKLQIQELIGQPIEAIVGVSREEGGWLVTLDVLELEKAPRTCDILATYVVELADDGDLRGYKRLRRYVRGRSDVDSYR